MRINLKVPFKDNAEAKKLGAQWCQKNRTWYVKDPAEIAPFLVWIQPGEVLWAGDQRPLKPRRDSKPGIATPRTDFSLPGCGCTHVAPWEDCEHTAPLGPEDREHVAHLRLIHGNHHA